MQDRSVAAFDDPSDTAPALSLREYWDILRRRKAVIMQTFVIVVLAGVLVTTFSPPTFRSVARLLVEVPTVNINQVNTDNPLAELLRVNQFYTVPTQVELLRNPAMLQTAGQKLGRKLPDLSVDAVPNTQIIEVTAEDSDPQLVAAGPNAVLDAYLEQLDSVNNAGIRKSLAFAEKGARDAEQRLNRAEAALADFKNRHRVADLDANRTAQLGEVGDLEQAYQQAQTQLSGVLAQIEVTKNQIRRSPRVASEVLSAEADPAIQALETSIVQLQAQRAGLLEEYTEINPRVLAVDAQIARLREREAEQRRTMRLRNTRANPAYVALETKLADLSTQASGLSAQAAQTGNRLVEARRRLGSFPSWEAEQSRLQRRLEAAKLQYTRFTQEREDLRLRAQSPRVSARIIERAQAPLRPVRPKKMQNIVFSVLLGLFFGLCFALLQEFMDDRINSLDEADRVLRLPNLGQVPAIEEAGLRMIRDAQTFSPIAEAYRSLRTNINFAAVDNPVRTLGITSSGPGEGKSTTIANLAVAMAMDNKRVIVVDADLRRPTQHKLFNLPASPGLTDILVGTHSIGDVIRPGGADGVQIIPAGSIPPNPAELLGSEAMAHFIDAVRTLADIVLFDSPPALAVADATLLASRVDGTLFVLAFGETRKTAARQALDLLSRARVPVLGTVLNKMDAGAGGYYYGKYYYTPLADADERNVLPEGTMPAKTNGASNGSSNGAHDTHHDNSNGNGANGGSNGVVLPAGKKKRVATIVTPDPNADLNDRDRNRESK